MAHITRHIGLSLGADICWPICFEAILKRLDLALPIGGDTLGFEVSRVTIEPFDLRQPVRYDLVIDRLTHWYFTSREWIKKAVVMNDTYVFNNPWSLQANEKHTSYCAMMRLGLKVPGTWMLPPKAYEQTADLQSTLTRYARLFDLGPIGAQLGYPLFMKPYDGGGWRALHRARPADARRELRPLRPPARPLPHGPRLPRPRTAIRARGHHAHDQRVLRLGLQFVRGAAARRRVAPDRLRQCVPGLAGHLAALPLPVADQGQPALGDLLCRHAPPRAPQPRLGAVFRGRRRGPAVPRETATLRAAGPADARRCRVRGAVADEFFGTEQARDAVRQKVAALFPAHEVEEFTELFCRRIQKWRADEARA